MTSQLKAKNVYECGEEPMCVLPAVMQDISDVVPLQHVCLPSYPFTFGVIPGRHPCNVRKL